MAKTPVYASNAIVQVTNGVGFGQLIGENPNRIAIWFSCWTAGARFMVSPSPFPPSLKGILVGPDSTLKLLRSEIGDSICYPWYYIDPSGIINIAITEFTVTG